MCNAERLKKGRGQGRSLEVTRAEAALLSPVIHATGRKRYLKILFSITTFFLPDMMQTHSGCRDTRNPRSLLEHARDSGPDPFAPHSLPLCIYCLSEFSVYIHLCYMRIIIMVRVTKVRFTCKYPSLSSQVRDMFGRSTRTCPLEVT